MRGKYLGYMTGYLTIRLGSDKKGDSFESFHISGGHVAGAFVIPLPLGIKGVKLHTPPCVGHFCCAMVRCLIPNTNLHDSLTLKRTKAYWDIKSQV